jgi:hypothetical protein
MSLCVFCQTGRPTKEHVCPQWISRLIREYKPGDTFTTIRRRPDGNDHAWTGNIIDIQAKIACRDCNGGWMSRIENDRAKPLLSPMIATGRPTYLTSPERRSIALWAQKTAMTFEYTAERYREHRTVFFTDPERMALKQGGEPHEDVAVWVAHYEGHRASTFHSAMDTLTSTVRKEAYAVHRSTMTAGHFAFQLIAVRDLNSGNLVPLASLGGIDMNRAAQQAILPVWPRLAAAAIPWPPPSGLNDEAFEDFIKSWTN